MSNPKQRSTDELLLSDLSAALFWLTDWEEMNDHPMNETEKDLYDRILKFAKENKEAIELICKSSGTND